MLAEKIRKQRNAEYNRNKYWRKTLEQRRAQHKRVYATPEGKYNAQRRQALQRGIVWEFTFELWMSWWGDDFTKRGLQGLIMSRQGDTGPYSPTNCVKITVAQNVLDGFKYRSVSSC